ncbi:MAG: ABC transporter permease [Chloroflexi bacterium]|nr:ABC transporter permease [Chloroflexota bacterium]
MTQANIALDSSGAISTLGRKQETMLSLTWRHFRKHRLALMGMAVLTVLVLGVILVPTLTNYDPGTTHILDKYEAPSLAHPMGTDGLGRDMLLRSMDGGRISLMIAFLAMLLAIGIGTLVGAIAGFYGGLADNLLMRLADMMLTMPTLFVAILLTQLLRAGVVPFLSAGITPIILVIAATAWMPVARLVRASFLSLKEKEFVEAARAGGAKNVRIMVRHILPNATSPIIVAATLSVGAAIITESGLSYLGFGVQPPIPTWGNMLQNAQAEMDYAPWTAIFPGILIFITVISVNYIGDGLRDALDPHHIAR